MPDPEIVRKVAEALTEIDPHVAEMFQHVVGDAARIVLAVAEPLIREQVADELHERARAFAHASPESIAVRRELMISANNIARGGQ
jgi:hypothetical protein